MKLVSFVVSGEERLGFLAGDAVVDPIRAGGDPKLFGSASTFIKASDAGRKAAAAMLANPPSAARLARKDVTLTAPIRPSTLLFSGSNYHDHNAEKANAPISGKEPEFFVKPTDCVIGPNEPLLHDPAISKKIDCETELAIVIGKPGRFIETARALDHVFGYTIVNDVTARDRQVRRTPEGMTWYELGSGKAFDSGAPLGPCIVTADEIANPNDLLVRFWNDGQLRHNYNTDDMEHHVPELIEFATTVMTLLSGDIIACGTNHEGLGALQDGETVEIEIQGIGRMSLKVADPLKRTWERGVYMGVDSTHPEAVKRHRPRDAGASGSQPEKQST